MASGWCDGRDCASVSGADRPVQDDYGDYYDGRSPDCFYDDPWRDHGDYHDDP